ncbi:MAG: hypothetical protein JXA44_11115 [Methanospirillaceae archaeon]|nr:hypothetical protein [Methanospirillaceae archaeon]
MIESLEVPENVMQRIIEHKTRSDESPIEVITRLLDYYDEDEEIDEETNQRIIKGLEDVDAGRYRPLRDIAKEMGI